MEQINLEYIYTHFDDYVDKIIAYYVFDRNARYEMRGAIYLSMAEWFHKGNIIETKPSAWVHIHCRFVILQSFTNKKLQKNSFLSFTDKDWLLDNNSYEEDYDHISKGELMKFIAKYMGYLKEKEQEVIFLRVVKSMTFEDIGVRLDIQGTYSSVYYHSGIKRLKRIIKDKQIKF